MNDYCVLKLENNDYAAMIISKSHETPFIYLEEIVTELKNQNIGNAKVIFDMLLCRGNSSERYTEAIFDGEVFLKSSFQFIKVNKKDILRHLAHDFYNSHIDILDNSILTSLQIKMIKKGIVI